MEIALYIIVENRGGRSTTDNKFMFYVFVSFLINFPWRGIFWRMFTCLAMKILNSSFMPTTMRISKIFQREFFCLRRNFLLYLVVIRLCIGMKIGVIVFAIVCCCQCAVCAAFLIYMSAYKYVVTDSINENILIVVADLMIDLDRYLVEGLEQFPE